VEAFQSLRTFVEIRVAELEPRSLIPELTEMGYAPREIEAIRQMNTVFSHGNQLYAIIAAVARHLLEIGDMAGGAEAGPFADRHAPEIDVPFILMEAHHADEATRTVYADIKRTLHA